MSGNKEHLFPVASLSRAQGLRLSRDNSRESLVAHPLLNTSPTSATTPASSSESPRYVPYTPRHRPPTSATTTATHVQQPAPVTASPLGGATGKLQLQNMKATAQSLGLTSESVGWAILQKLVDAENGPEWDDVWSTLDTGRATLLLPAENLSSQDVIGPEFVKDHVAFCTAVPSQSGAAVTLSGLRAAWEEDTMTFRSTLPTSSKRFAAILQAESSNAGLLALPPIPSTSAYQYPTNTILAYEPKLPLAPQSAHDGKPLLPPRPSARAAASAATTGSVSRLSNPFASLFARPGTPSAGASSSAASSEPHAALEVPALAVNKKIVRKELYKEITIGITSEIKSALSDLPAAVVSKVLAFVAPLYPSPKAPRASAVANGSPPTGAVAPPPGSSPDIVSDALQTLYATLEHDLEQHKTEDKQTYTDEEVRALMDRIESAICTIFYDHFFRPSESDDASHDEALASRVAALNMLDLSLDHLGVDTIGQTAAVEGVVRTCGDVLQKLGDSMHRSPSVKAGLLVEAHRVIVDGLSKLRPIQLKPEGEPDMADQEKPSAAMSSLEPGAEKEMADPALAPPVTTAAPDTATADTGGPAANRPSTQDIAAPDPAPAATQPPPLPPRPHTPPRIPPSPSPAPTPVAGDILLPILIFSVVKANPAQLVSHLLYVQRFRSRSVQGEESYCLVNLMAVVEFLENVDMSALGLGDSQRVMSVSDLTPIPLVHAADASAASQSASARLRGQVGELADSANKVLSGVTGSIGALRGLLPFHTPALGTPAGERSALAEIQDSAPWNAERPGFGMLRRASGFSIASLPGFQKVVRGTGAGAPDEGQREMVEVPSRAASLRGVRGESGDESEGSSQGSESGEDSDDDGDDQDANGAVTMDTRSVRSFSSMMSKGSGRASKRLSLSDRLANASKGSPSTPSKNVPLPTIHLQTGDSPARSQSPVPMAISTSRIAPPSQRFMTVNEADLRLGEVGELLREYRRVVEGLRALGGFRES
ncbi:hypothetical protein AURDEDRAFT_113071 [Auricularia subglabra TFB-10046 SS5]|nr:hypothetical protein AURDEDRAFT_113071 [Auricularia subglabra TFB-10046 SS5]